MQSLLSDLQSWYAAQCDDTWEHGRGIEITTLDNPGWRLVVHLEETLLENKNFPRLERHETEGAWIECFVEENKFIGTAGHHQLEELMGIFLAWAKTEPNWLAVKYETAEERKARIDDELWKLLGEETGSGECRKIGCSRRHVAHSAFCREHHFEMIRGYRPPDFLVS